MVVKQGKSLIQVLFVREALEGLAAFACDKKKPTAIAELEEIIEQRRIWRQMI